MDDKSIVELLFSRDETAINQTAEKYGKLCYSISFNILNSHEDSEETVNDVYSVLWKTVPPNKPDSLKFYVCKIARNLALKRYEHKTAKKRSQYLTVSMEELGGILPDTLIADGISDEDIGKHINIFLSTLSQQARNVFVRKYYFFDDIKSISQRYNFSQSKVKNLLYKTRNELKKYLISEGIYI